MGSLSCPTLANAFLASFEKNWLHNSPYGFKPPYYQQYVDDIFVLFTWPEHLDAFWNFSNGWYAKCHLELKIENRMSFLDIQSICEDKVFMNSVYCKPTFREVYTHFGSFLVSTYNFGTVYKLTYNRGFQTWLNWTKLQNELLFSKEKILRKWLPWKFYK